MSYAAIRAGVEVRLHTIPELLTILNYEPKAIQKAPAAYVLLDSFTRNVSGQITATTYRILVRALVLWQDNEGAEKELAVLVDKLPIAIDQDPQFAGAVTSGIADVRDGKGNFVTVSGTLYRTVDVYVTVVDKTTYAGAL